MTELWPHFPCVYREIVAQFNRCPIHKITQSERLDTYIALQAELAQDFVDSRHFEKEAEKKKRHTKSLKGSFLSPKHSNSSLTSAWTIEPEAVKASIFSSMQFSILSLRKLKLRDGCLRLGMDY